MVAEPDVRNLFSVPNPCIKTYLIHHYRVRRLLSHLGCASISILYQETDISWPFFLKIQQAQSGQMESITVQILLQILKQI